MSENPYYDYDTRSVKFMHKGRECHVSCEALSDHFGSTKKKKNEYLEVFYNNKRKIQDAVEKKSILQPEGIIIVTSADL